MGPGEKFRRLVALLLCTYMVFFSMARAGMAAVMAVTLVFCFCLRQYRLLVKMAALVLFLIAVSGMFDPEALNQRAGRHDRCRALQGAQGRRRAGFAADAVGKDACLDQGASVVWNGIRHEPDRRGSRIEFRNC